jgi:hypothetical protein
LIVAKGSVLNESYRHRRRHIAILFNIHTFEIIDFAINDPHVICAERKLLRNVGECKRIDQYGMLIVQLSMKKNGRYKLLDSTPCTRCYAELELLTDMKFFISRKKQQICRYTAKTLPRTTYTASA